MKKVCIKCNISYDILNFYFYKNRNYTDNNCKECRKIDWKQKRQIREQKLILLGYNSIHDYRVKVFSDYNEYCKIRSSIYHKESDSKRKKKNIYLLTDYYIKELIKKDKSMNNIIITPELIEIYRLNVQLKREINNVRKIK